LASKAVYYGAAVLGHPSRRTLGEEYADVVPVASGGPLAARTAAVVLMLPILAPYAARRAERAVAAAARPRVGGEGVRLDGGRGAGWRISDARAPAVRRTAAAAVALRRWLKRAHLGVFFVFGAYYHVAKRLCGVRYVLA